MPRHRRAPARRASRAATSSSSRLARDEGAYALLTTPGAGKWYRSGGPWARQSLAFEAGKGACLEWLPQETIVFDGALADLRTEVQLAADARFIGWEVLCLGRTGAGERYARGECRLRTVVKREGRPLWLERGSHRREEEH